MGQVRTDEWLCGRVQIGDREAADELITRYRHLVLRLTSATRPPAHIEFDDVAQIGYLALYSAAKKWRGGRGASFKTVAYCYVGRDVRRYVKQESARKRPEVNGQPEALDAAPDRSRVNRTDVACYLKLLDADQAAVIRLTYGIDGVAIGPVLAGRQIGKNRKQVQNILATALERLRELAAQPVHEGDRNG